MTNQFTSLQKKHWLKAMLIVGLILVMVLPAGMVSAVGTNLALNKTATSSSIEGTGFEAGKAVDGSATTRWASVEPAPNTEWIYVDLGSTTAIGEVILKWEAAYAKSYQVQTSDDASTWTNIYSTTTGDGATDDLTVSGSGRYVRVSMSVRGTAYGYSLWELEVYGTGGATATNTSVAPTATRTNTPVASTATNTSTAPTATRTNTSVPPTATNTAVASGNLALNKTATSSSSEGTGFEAGKAVDGSATTRWASVEPAPNTEWIYVDLGQSYSISHVVLKWEAAYGKSYQVQTSDDHATWTNIYSTTTGDGATDDLTGLSGSGRYVRVNCTVRGTAYGYSLYEFEVYGSGGGATATNTSVPPTATNTAVGPTATRTNTPVPPTATNTSVAPTATRTNTPVPPTATRTNTAVPPTATATSASVSHPANELFDDFTYTGPSDNNLTSFGWAVRNDTGGPGPTGSGFKSSNVTFVTDPGNASNKFLRMAATTNGTAGTGTSQAQLDWNAYKFLEGTYATRFYFSDAPTSGSPDGDEINETFFTITPLNFDLDPAYSENDFEYLANGGWGIANSPTMWNTTWETYRPDPWLKDGVSTSTVGSLNGWHDLLMTVSGGQTNGHVKYYVDGVLVADHSGKYYPESLMSIDYNIWYIPETLGNAGTGTTRTYIQQADWMYFAQNTVLNQAQVNALVADFRAQALARKNNVP